MQREIKFKGKRVDNGEWVEGDLITTPDPFKQDCILEFIGCPRVFVEVDPETVCQFTGLKDKNGVEIYEGGKLRFGDEESAEEYYLVVRNEENARFQLDFYSYDMHLNEGSGEEWPNEISCIERNALDMDTVFIAEVVGNIFDNPELLKQENNENETEK